MKKLFILLMVAFVAFAASAQQGRLRTLPTDTVKGAETIYFQVIPITGTYNSLSVSAKCTQLGGTSDGYMVLLASDDGTNYFNLNNDVGKMIWGSPNARMSDSITCALSIYSTATLNWVLPDPPHRFYKMQATGTASDTTKLVVTYVLK